eukprot:scaffold726_cov262-Pinguiococcus_pyrenoidosus.AAC.10
MTIDRCLVSHCRCSSSTPQWGTEARVFSTNQQQFYHYGVRHGQNVYPIPIFVDQSQKPETRTGDGKTGGRNPAGPLGAEATVLSRQPKAGPRGGGACGGSQRAGGVRGIRVQVRSRPGTGLRAKQRYTKAALPAPMPWTNGGKGINQVKNSGAVAAALFACCQLGPQQWCPACDRPVRKWKECPTSHQWKVRPGCGFSGPDGLMVLHEALYDALPASAA